jgi:MFS family permease
MRPYLPTAISMGRQRRDAAHPYRHYPWVMVWSMAVAQVISWGTLFYAFSLFVVPMQESLGWSRPLLNGALSLGLLSMGVAAFPVGAWIDRHGGRGVMTLGSLAQEACSCLPEPRWRRRGLSMASGYSLVPLWPGYYTSRRSP